MSSSLEKADTLWMNALGNAVTFIAIMTYQFISTTQAFERCNALTAHYLGLPSSSARVYRQRFTIMITFYTLRYQPAL